MKKLWQGIRGFVFGSFERRLAAIHKKVVAIEKDINILAERDRLNVDDADISRIHKQIHDVTDNIEQLKSQETEDIAIQRLEVEQIGVQHQQNRLDALDNDRKRKQREAAEDDQATGE